MQRMIRLNGYLLLAALLLTLVGFRYRNQLPSDVKLSGPVAEEPRQTPVQAKPFQVSLEGVDYLVEPSHSYEINGLVVSFNHHDGNSSLHRLWNDHLNMLDVCVVWSDTADSGVLDRLKFWNGEFTCNMKTNDAEAWAAFNMEQLSNNHLLSGDETIRSAVRNLRVGDQIRIKGWLASYSANGGPKRGTSTIRTDTGNGACETIYVRDYQLLEQSEGPWRGRMKLGLLLMLISTVVHFLLPYRPD